VRDGLAMILAAQPDIEVVAEAADGAEALSLARRHEPDVVLMAVRMPRLNGVEATRRVLDAVPTSRVLVLTTFDVDDAVLGALRAGASGFLLKDAARDSLLAAVRAVAEGQVLLDADVAARLVSEHLPATPSPEAAGKLQRLTPREMTVLRELSRGLSNAEIAAELGLGEATVKSHVAKLLEKLDARDRVQLVVFALSHGIVA
jgi:DNA-binding NarL/FixJ family response regulator